MAERLGDTPAKAFRELYDSLDLSLDLKFHYQPGDRSLDIEVTIAGQVCLVHPVAAVPRWIQPARASHADTWASTSSGSLDGRYAA